MAKLFQGSSKESFILLSKELVNHTNFPAENLKGPSNNKISASINSELQAKVYSIFISHRKDDSRRDLLPNSELNELEKIVWYSHVLFKKREFDKFNRLNRLFKSLQTKGLLLPHSDVRAVLQFLTHLIDVDGNSKNEPLSFPTPWIFLSFKNGEWDLPLGPLNYNETRLHHIPSRWYYTHFPSYLFEIDVKNSLVERSSSNFSSCNAEPGVGLKYNFFQNEEKSPDNYLGALIGPKKCPVTPDTELSIPDLPSIPEGYSFVPFFLSQYIDVNYKCSEGFGNSYCDEKLSKPHLTSSGVYWETLDEGYGSSQGSCQEKSSKRIDIWETILSSSPLPNHHTWESAFKAFANKQKPFVSEAGYKVTDKLWIINSHHLSNLTSLLPNHPFLKISSEMLCSDIINLLMGIPSSCFIWNKVNQKFENNEAIHCRGITAESSQLQNKEFIRCGTQIARLENFIIENEKYSGDESRYSLVFRAFISSVKGVLLVYRRKVLSLLGENKILSLKLHTDSLRNKIQYLYNICFSAVIEDGIPCKGLSLIGALKNELLFTQQPSNAFLLLSLLKTSCKPFFRFMEQWIYEGELYDPASEFMVCRNLEAIHMRDRSFWQKGHIINQLLLTGIPDMLKEVLVQAFQCGKALNLLQVCSPQNILLRRAYSPYPKITLCMTINDVELTRKECSDYYTQLQSSNEFVTFSQVVNLKKEAQLGFPLMFKKGQNSAHHPPSENSVRKDKMNWVQKKIALKIIKADIKQASEWKEQEKRRIEEEDLKVQKIHDQILKEKEEKDIKIRNKLNEYYQQFMLSLEKREKIAIQKLLGLSDNAVDNLTVIPAQDGSSQTSQCSYSESISQMSLTADSLDTPMEDEIPDLSEDFITDVIPGNVVNNALNQCEEVNNNPGSGKSADENIVLKDKISKANVSKMIDIVFRSPNHQKTSNYALGLDAYINQETMMKKEIGLEYGYALHDQKTYVASIGTSTELMDADGNYLTDNGIKDSLNGNLPRKKFSADMQTVPVDGSEVQPNGIYLVPTTKSMSAKRPRPVSEIVESIPENGYLLKDSSSYKGLGIHNSKSDSFQMTEITIHKRKGLQSSLFNLSESDRPVIVDTTPDWCVNDILPDTRFVDKELLNCRVLKPMLKLVPYQTIQLDISDQDPIEDISETVLKEISDNIPQSKCGDRESAVLPSLAFLAAAPTCLIRALSIHVSTQTRLVNEMLLSHLLVQNQLMDHFFAIKSLLLLNDVSFARSLASSLFSKFTLGNRSSRLFNPGDLNGLLHEAVAASQFAKSPFANNLSFVVTNIPSSINNVCNPLEYIHLRYQVRWPNCIVLDDAVFNTYGSIWKFLIKLHYVVWAVDDTFKHLIYLDRGTGYEGIKKCIQFHQISLYRHEMHQFIKKFFNYVAHQGIQGGWIKFQSDLLKKVATVDDLYEVHRDLQNNVIGKCFLTSEAMIVQDTVQTIFDKVLVFRSILLGHTWKRNSVINQFEHPMFLSLQKTADEIRKLSLFLNKLILKILSSSYSEPLSDLAAQLNYNTNDQRTASSF